MYHYLFTNDLRISNLQNMLSKTGKCFVTDTVPSAAENKSENNNMMTLAFYFNLTQSSNCAHCCADGDIRKVVLNFIKKFQFPNPRTLESLKQSVDDAITIAPMRVILKLLYTMNMLYPGSAHLNRDEIRNFVFYNSVVAKTKNPDILQVINQIIEFRKTGVLPQTVETDPEKAVWAHEARQIREMVKILTWSGCVQENENQEIVIHHDSLTENNKAALFDILTYSAFWTPIMDNSFSAIKSDYQQYMDMDYIQEDNCDKADDLMNLDNQAFIFALLELMKSHQLCSDENLAILQDKDKCIDMFKHYSLNGILLKYDEALSADEQRKDSSGHPRYYSEKIKIADTEYFVSSEWRPDREEARKDIVNWVISMINEIKYKTGYQSKYGRNRILFGAPGTGKSFTLNGDRKELLYGDREVDEETIDRSLYGEYERVTFHPDYSYANFVGTYKPVPCKDDQGHDAITYSYVPGPFMRTYVKALLNSRTDSPKPYLLVIEEINRANVAAVFGDVFQLLDRDDDEVSEYAIQASEDIKKYLAEKLGGDPEEYAEIRIPDNMFIWATMNSADQGVFPMDTAFKRRWDFTYLGIDDSEDGIKGKTVVLGEGQYKRVVEWNKLRKAINDELLTYKVNEDKLMGPYFISKKNLPEGTEIDVKTFTRIFKNKVIMYLFDDAAKQKRLTLFGGCDEKSKSQYSKICSEFDKKGVYIFCDAISNQFIDSVPANEVKEDDAE